MWCTQSVNEYHHLECCVSLFSGVLVTGGSRPREYAKEIPYTEE